MEEGERILQIGGAIKHHPLPSLTSCTLADDEPHDKKPSFRLSNKSALGGFIGEGQLAWRALGPTVEVLDPTTCSRQAAWTFGAILHNASPVVTCVCGIGTGSITHIVIGVNLGSDQTFQGMVGVLSLRRSRIIRAFHFPHKVTSVCMVLGGEKVVDPSTLANELRPSQGLVAVGTSGASLYLVDLALDLGDEITSDEMCPASFAAIGVPSPVPDMKRNEAISSGRHPMLFLSDNINDGKVFRLLGPDDTILYETMNRDISITSLLYVPQLASLVVGYNFGSFQLMNLNLITIDCASPYEENLPPVFSFAYQEPENDPRSFVYLWVCRSFLTEVGECLRREKRSTCSLYAMNYEKKEWIEGHGLWYQGLASVSPRFDFDASSAIGSSLPDAMPSRIVSAMAVVGTSLSATLTATPMAALIGDTLTASDEEAEPVPELSLSLFCWEVNVLDRGEMCTHHFIAIFDINQWYQSQMPSRLRLSREELCPFMSFHTLDRVPKSMDETLLGGAPARGTWSRHCSRSACERVWYPSSLSYEFNLLTSEGLATYRCPSVQQSALTSLVQSGPGAIVHPHSAFTLCAFSGIVSSVDTFTTHGGSLTVLEREQLLDTALEYHLLSLLVQCVVEFSEGRFAHLGCSSQFILEWAWKRLRDIKSSSDTLCAPLFTSSQDGCNPLSSQCLVNLHQNLTFLTHLTAIVTAIRDHAGEVTFLSAGELEGRVQVANLLQLQLQAILWFYHCGLLPQSSLQEPPDDGSVPFPAKTLHNIYEKRRGEVKRLGPSKGGGVDLLLIDSIMEECGDLLSEVWERGEGEEGVLYPPPSLHALLSMYLLPAIPTHTKHRIVQYLFLDLASILSENFSSVLEELVKYPSSFSLSPSLIKLTQGFWLIDNKDFQAGLSVLLDPLVNPRDITQSQHRKIIQAFLYQGEESHALAYTQIRRPPMYELEDVRIVLTVLLANGRIREAFHYQRNHRVAANSQDLLRHFFNGCEQLDRLESVVHLPLSPLEESSFVAYLTASQHPSAQDILLVYYLQQARFEKITSLHEAGLKNNSTLISHRKHKTRTALVQGYISHLPDVRTRLAATGSSKAQLTRAVYSKPQPLSAHIRQSTSAYKTPQSKATALRAFPSPSSWRGAEKTPYTPFASRSERRRIFARRGEGGLSHTSKLSSYGDMEMTRVVFPTRAPEPAGPLDESGTCPLTPPLLNTTSILATPMSERKRSGAAGELNLLQEGVSRLMEQVLRESMLLSKSCSSVTATSHNRTKDSTLRKLNVSSEVVDLLKTPPVTRRSTTKPMATGDSLPDTPQSILKVRKILQQTQLGSSDTETTPFAFSLHRLSAKASRNKSVDASQLASETSLTSLTPKQLRFNLTTGGTGTSIDGVAEEENWEEEASLEEPEGPPTRTSLPRKRKRAESPPPMHSSLDQPTPRKPLPGYKQDDELDVNCNLSCDSDGEIDDGTIAESSHHGLSLNKYRSFSEVKDSSRTTPKRASNSSPFVAKDRQGNVFNSSNVFEKDKELSHLSSRESHQSSDSENAHEESFHSIEEFVSLDNKGDDERSASLSKRSEREATDELIQRETTVDKRTPSNSKQRCVSFTYSDRKIVEKSRWKTESVEKVYRVTYNSPTNETSKSEQPALGQPSPDTTQSLQKTAAIVDMSFTRNEIQDECVSESAVTAHESVDDEQDREMMREVNQSYVLRFSDSEDEKSCSEQNKSKSLSPKASSTEQNVLASSTPKKIGIENTPTSYPSDREVLPDNTALLSNSGWEGPTKSLTASSDTQTYSSNEPELSDAGSGNLPLDLINVPPMRLSSTEEEIVDQMLKGNHPLSPHRMNNRAFTEEHMDNKTLIEHMKKALADDDKDDVPATEEGIQHDSSNIPVLEFSDDDEEEESKIEPTEEVGTQDRPEEPPQTPNPGEKGSSRRERKEEEELGTQDKPEEPPRTPTPAEEASTKRERKEEEVLGIQDRPEEPPRTPTPGEEGATKRERKEEEDKDPSAPMTNGPSDPNDEENSNDSTETVVFDLNQVPFLMVSAKSPQLGDIRKEVTAKQSPAETLEEEEGSETEDPLMDDAAEVGDESRYPRTESELGVSLVTMETSPDNNNVPKASPEPPKKEGAKPPTPLLTPSRRSRRLSGLTPDDSGQLERVLIPTPVPPTPRRRGGRNMSGSTTPSKVLATPSKVPATTSNTLATPNTLPTPSKVPAPPSNTLATPSKVPAPPPNTLATPSNTLATPSKVQAPPTNSIATPTSRRRRAIKGQLETTQSSDLAALPGLAQGPVGFATPPPGGGVVGRVIRSSEEVTPPPIPSPTEGKRKTTPRRAVATSRNDTPRRRSARLSGTVGDSSLGTIVEDAGTQTPQKTSSSGVPASPVKAKTPTRARRTSLLKEASEMPLLETIREDSELSSSAPTPQEAQAPSHSLTPAVSLATATPTLRPLTPTRKSRRRSASEGDPSTDDKENTSRNQAPSRAGSTEDSLPVARRTRRASLSSKDSLQTPSKISSLTPLEDQTSKEPVQKESPKCCEAPIGDYNVLSPLASAHERESYHYLSYVSLLSSNSKHSNLASRKSLKLSIPCGYEFTFDEPPEGKRKPRRRKTTTDLTDTSVMVLRNSPPEMGGNDPVFETEEPPPPTSPIKSECGEVADTEDLDERKTTPQAIYHLLEAGSEQDPRNLPRRVSRPRMRRSLMKGIPSLTVVASQTAEGEEEEKEDKRATKKVRKLSTTKSGKKENNCSLKKSGDNQAGFVFQKPEEIVSTPEAVSEVFQQLTREHEKIVSESFVFSPPLTLNENKRKKRPSNKKKSRK